MLRITRDYIEGFDPHHNCGWDSWSFEQTETTQFDRSAENVSHPRSFASRTKRYLTSWAQRHYVIVQAVHCAPASVTTGINSLLSLKREVYTAVFVVVPPKTERSAAEARRITNRLMLSSCRTLSHSCREYNNSSLCYSPTADLRLT